MDWPVIGAVSAAVVVAGAVTFEVVVFMQSGSTPIKRAPQFSSYSAPVERSANEIPGFSTGKATDWTPSFPLIRLIESDSIPQPETRIPADQAPRPPTPKKMPEASAPGNRNSSIESSDNPAATGVRIAKLTAPDIKPRTEQWRVVVTEKASYFNLGGHVDSAGIVDNLASSHLRDALRSHRNFAQLPPDIRTHIITQNINLTKVAPYRGLLGMNDKTLEEEQAIRFERVANR